jgi:hypothetical protein
VGWGRVGREWSGRVGEVGGIGWRGWRVGDGVRDEILGHRAVGSIDD